MTTDFTGKLSEQQVSIKLDNLGIINYYATRPETVADESIFFIMKQNEILGLSFGTASQMKDATDFLEIVVPDYIIPADFFYFLTKEISRDGYDMNVEYKMTISPESVKVYQQYWQQVLPLLKAFGLRVNVVKKVASKPRHKYSKDLAQTPFTVDYKGSTATVYWRKRNEFVIKSGATLVADAPLTKAGIIGFAGKFGLRLRQEHVDQIKDNSLINDVVLRSVNEVGTFLYFAGTNSWLQLKSPEGKTLDELTVVK